MTVAGIPRIERPSTKDFESCYFVPQRPVVITNLYDGQPIADIRTIERGLAAFGGAEVTVRPRYTDVHPCIARATETPSPAPYVTSVGRYLERAIAGEAVDQIVADELTPTTVRRMFQIPEVASTFDRLNELVSHTFIAQAGAFAHLHFDTDHQSALLTQVFGRKRVILFEPSAARHLLPVCSFAGVSLAHMGEMELDCLLERAGAVRTVLAPGETLFIPALYWHYVDYIDTGMSFNVRFGRNRYNRFFAMNFLPDYRIQALSAFVAHAEERLADEIVGKVIAAFVNGAPTRSARYRAVRAATELLWRKHVPDGILTPYHLFDLSLQEDFMFESLWQSGDLYQHLKHSPRAAEPA